MHSFTYIITCMKTVNINSKRDLPRDPEELRALSWDLIMAYHKLTEKYQKLVAKHYGRSSEKLGDQTELDALQMEMDALLDEALTVERQSEEIEQDTIEIKSYRRRRKHSGRNAIPEELIEEKVIEVTEDEQRCAKGHLKEVIGQKEHVVVERVPAKYRVTRYIRPILACKHCKDEISIAEPVVLPIPKGLAGPHLLTFVMLSKYLYHLPLYRIQRQIFHESRIWFTRSTLVSWVRRVCGLLERIHRALLHEYRASRIKHADETPLDVVIDGRRRSGYMWIGLSGDGRTAAFIYNRHRSGKAALDFLAGSKPGGYLMVDDCPSYNKAIKALGLIDQRCMVHIRRKFVEARKTGRHVKFHDRILIKIGQLYRIERFAAEKRLSNGHRGELREKYSRRIMSQIKALLVNPGFAVLPQSATGGAINHFLSNWTQATRFLDSGDLPIDNSADERIIRPFAIGRNNWGHAGSEDGANWMAILYSIITTCKLNDIDPHEYLSDVLMRLVIRPENADVTDLTPVQWHKARNDGQDPKATPLYPSKN
ncbi:MAG: IS66 family transposase [Chitinivibrionales bacterium]|nr:IS66 family transposase [Chitinivibrionales bacterium]